MTTAVALLWNLITSGLAPLPVPAEVDVATCPARGSGRGDDRNERHHNSGCGERRPVAISNGF